MTHIPENIKELVITRIEVQASPHLRLSIGSHGSMGKEEMIKHVKEEDEIGERIVQAHLHFLQAVASGELVKAVVSIP